MISAESMKKEEKTSAPVFKGDLDELNEIKYNLMAKYRKPVTIADVISILIAEHKERSGPENENTN